MKKTLYVLDLDRTLIDTDKVIKMLAISLKSQGYDGDDLVDEIEKARISEKDIDAKTAIDSLGQGAWESVEDYFFKEADKNNIVFDDTQPFLDRLRSAKLPYIILTFGVSKDWQYLKLASTGLDNIPFIVSKSREKSKTINTWKSDSGVYSPPGFSSISGDNIVLVDDRPNAFLHMSESFEGYLVDRPGNLARDFPTPPNVRIISSLNEINV